MEQQQDFLQPFEEVLYHERVSAGVRFANYIIDIIIFYVLTFLAGALIGVVIVATRSTSAYYESTANGSAKFFYYFVALATMVGYYTITEAAFKGRSIGKMITGCKAIMNDGGDITWRTAFLRSLSRLVPFEQLSALGGNPWHDQWTNTVVVKVRKK